MLTENQKNVKLIDFGLAREESVTEMMTAETGTYRWMAPEVGISVQSPSQFSSKIHRFQSKKNSMKLTRGVVCKLHLAYIYMILKEGKI